MRRVFALFLVLVLICSVSCTPHEPAPTDPEAKTTTTTTASVLSDDETELIEGTGTTTTTAPGETTTTTGAVDDPKPTTTTTTTKKQPAVITTTTTTTTAKKPEVTTTTTEPQVNYGDEKVVAEAVVKYINQYRTEEGQATATIVPGLTVIAEERSKQLVTNFAHDVHAERELLAKYQYGEYVDPADYGDPDGVGYYTSGAGEAIGTGGMGGTIDSLAQSIAFGVKNSANHWRYVGNGDNIYIAVGITFSRGSWYCCIYVSDVSYG